MKLQFPVLSGILDVEIDESCLQTIQNETQLFVEASKKELLCVHQHSTVSRTPLPPKAVTTHDGRRAALAAR
jgi:hypothetical protein